ncbi:MAG: hypothetical protein WC284_09650 [Candidimonas sp.]
MLNNEWHKVAIRNKEKPYIMKCRQWCMENTQENWTYYVVSYSSIVGYTKFSFQKLEDALLFEMTFPE